MTNLAEEAVTVLMRTVTYKEVAAVQQKTQGIARPGIRRQSRDVMRLIVEQRVRNSALSDAERFLDELAVVEAQM